MYKMYSDACVNLWCVCVKCANECVFISFFIGCSNWEESYCPDLHCLWSQSSC